MLRTIGEARQAVSSFLSESGCYDICAQCPIYPGGVGCCEGCEHLLREGDQVQGCGNPNLSCLSYTCAALSENLRRQGKLDEFIELVYPLPREGYRGNQRREEGEPLELQDPLRLVVSIQKEQGSLSLSTKEDPNNGSASE